MNKLEPQEHTWIGPNERRSEPNFGGSFALFLRSVGRRNTGYPYSSQPVRAGVLFADAHIVLIHTPPITVTGDYGVS